MIQPIDYHERSTSLAIMVRCHDREIIVGVVEGEDISIVREMIDRVKLALDTKLSAHAQAALLAPPINSPDSYDGIVSLPK